MKSVRHLFAFALAGALSAHFAWVELDGPLTAGKPVQVKIGFGHEVGNSESAIPLEGLKLMAVDPDGGTAELKPAASGNWIAAGFTPAKSGAHRFVMTQDRGVMSQTTKGYKPGGRDVHPDAKKSMKMWRSAVVYSAAAGSAASAAPLKLPLEIMASPKAAGEVELTVLREGAPLSAAEVRMNVPGSEDTLPVGKTGADGKLVVKKGSQKGPALYVVALADPAPKDANYDTNNLTSVLEVVW